LDYPAGPAGAGLVFGTGLRSVSAMTYALEPLLLGTECWVL
jgi:hypothetical protein